MTPKEIKALRKELGLSQQAFSDLAGVTLMTVSVWERGKFMPLPKAERRLRIIKADLEAQKALGIFP
jgi:DNA-binding transcriptional regulator YiaG